MEYYCSYLMVYDIHIFQDIPHLVAFWGQVYHYRVQCIGWVLPVVWGTITRVVNFILCVLPISDTYERIALKTVHTFLKRWFFLTKNKKRRRRKKLIKTKAFGIKGSTEMNILTEKNSQLYHIAVWKYISISVIAFYRDEHYVRTIPHRPWNRHEHLLFIFALETWSGTPAEVYECRGVSSNTTK